MRNGALAPGRFRKSDAQFDLLMRVFTPRTVFMQIGAADCELALRAAGYVERVWCVEAAARAERAPCNLRQGPIGGVPLSSIDVAFSARAENPLDVWKLLKPGAVWFIYGAVVRAPALVAAGFSRVQYYGGSVALPAALARLSRIASTAAYK
jgi:hypothetical protein